MMDCRVDSTIELPRATMVQLDVGEGDVWLSELSGETDVSLRMGRLVADGLRVPELRFSGGVGAAVVELLTAPEVVSMAFGRGEVYLETPSQMYETLIESGDGRVSVEGIQDGDGPEIAITLASGDVEVIGR